MMRLFAVVLAVLSVGGVAGASPVFSLQQSGSTSVGVTYTLAQKPATLALDVHLNTDLLRIDGLDFHINGAAPYASSFSISAGQGPFTAGDAQITPAAGSPASTLSKTSLFHSAVGTDFPASADYNLLTYGFSLSALGVGTYTFTPVGEAFTDSPNLVFSSAFGTPTPFTLTITVPEPAGLGLGGLAIAGLLPRRTRQRKTV